MNFGNILWKHTLLFFGISALLCCLGAAATAAATTAAATATTAASAAAITIYCYFDRLSALSPFLLSFIFWIYILNYIRLFILLYCTSLP